MLWVICEREEEEGVMFEREREREREREEGVTLEREREGRESH